MADIGRGAAHVEADDLGEAGGARRFHRADDAPGRSRENCVLAPEQIGRCQSSRGLHEQKPWRRAASRECFSHAVDVAAEQRREISVDHGGIAAPDELHQRAHLVTRGNLREAGSAGERSRLAFVLGEGVSMHEDDRDGCDALGARGAERRYRRRVIERHFDRAVRTHAFRHFGDACIEHRRLLDAPRENLRPRLVADLQCVAEASADDEEERIALALEQRVGCDRGAHPHDRDAVRGKRLAAWAAEQVGDAGDGRVRIGLRILREQLMGYQAPIGGPGDDVGERAATVDEEVPPAAAIHPMRFSPAAYCFQRLT